MESINGVFRLLLLRLFLLRLLVRFLQQSGRCGRVLRLNRSELDLLVNAGWQANNCL